MTSKHEREKQESARRYLNMSIRHLWETMATFREEWKDMPTVYTLDESSLFYALCKHPAVSAHTE